MNITWSEIVVWLIIGALAGSLAGIVVKQRRAGFGALSNIIIGLIGALIGGFIFKVFNINLGLGSIAINVEQLVAAFVGSLIFLLILRLIRK